MSAEVHALPRPASGGRAPLVPAKVVFKEEGIYLRSDPALLDTPWYRRCSAAEFRAANALRHRSLKQQPAGSLPDDDTELAFLSDNGLNVAAWKRARTRAIEGWVLCADGRYYHPEVARNVLHIWIGRLETRRVSSWGNKGRIKEGAGRVLDSIMADMDEALEALAAIDPQDAVVSRGLDQQAKWYRRLAAASANADGQYETLSTETPYEGPNRWPNRPPSGGGPKVRQAKRSQEDSSSPLQGDDSSDHQTEPEQEFELEEGSAERTAPSPAQRERAPPWPTDWFGVFQARFPKREAWGRAEKALERIRKAGKVPIEEIMAGVERLVARIASGQLQVQYVPQPAKWLDGRGWEDEPAAGPAAPGRAEILPPARASPGPSITMRAAMRAARRLGIDDEPRSDL